MCAQELESSYAVLTLDQNLLIFCSSSEEVPTEHLQCPLAWSRFGILEEKIWEPHGETSRHGECGLVISSRKFRFKKPGILPTYMLFHLISFLYPCPCPSRPQGRPVLFSFPCPHLFPHHISFSNNAKSGFALELDLGPHKKGVDFLVTEIRLGNRTEEKLLVGA